MSGRNSDLVRNLIGRIFTDLAGDTRRAQGLMREAMPAIVANFHGLQEQVASHVGMVDDLSQRLQGNDGAGGLLQAMRVVIDTFVKDLIDVSQQSMRIVERVDMMRTEVNAVIGNIDKIEEMAHTTRFIALNATIEAHRNAAGQSFQVVAGEVKRLAGDAENFSARIRDAIERCHRRLNETHQLVGVLASHDMTVVLSAQSGLVNTVSSIGEANKRMADTLHELDAKVRHSIRALQFDDIVMQLLGGIEHRLGLLEQVWVESLPPSMSDEDTQRLVSAFERLKPEFESRRMVAQQQSMDAGTAELF